MANYDASIRVSTKVDSSELEKVAKAFNDIEHKSDDATDSVEEFDKASSNVDADTYKEQAKALGKVNSELDKSVEKKKESQIWSKEEEARIDSIIAKMKEKQDMESQDVSAGEARTVDFDWQKNAEETAQISARVEEISTEMDKANEKIAASDEYMNQLRVDVEEYANALKELEGEGKYFGDNDYDQVYLAWKDAVDAVKEYESNLNKLTVKGMAEQEARITREKERQAEQQRKIEEAAERNLQRENARIQREAQAEAMAAARQQRELQKQAEQEAKLREQEAEEQRLQNIRENAEVSDQKMVDLLEEQARLQERIADLKKAGLTAGYKDYDNATTELQRVQEQIRKRKYGSGQTPYTAEGFRKVASAARASFNALVTGSRRANGPLTKIHNRLSSIAMSALLFNQVSRGINAAMSGAKEGFQNLAKYSDETNKTMSEFKGTLATTKNSLAVAFEPVVTTAVPYLIQLLDVLNAACDSFARFIAICSADYTYVRAKKQMVDYADSINSASKAANNALASFDELNTLSQSASGSGSNAGDMFEEVETGVPSDWTSGMIDAINNGDWNKAGTLLAEKINEAADQIDYYEIGSKIGKGLNSAFAAGNGFLTTIDTRSIGEGFATMLNAAMDEIDENIVGKTAAESINRIFDAAFGFLSTFDFKAAGLELGGIINGFFENVNFGEAGQNVSLLATGILEFFTIAVEETDWATVGEKIGEFFKGIDWFEILFGAVDLVAEAIKAIFKTACGMVNGLFGPKEKQSIADQISSTADAAYQSVIEDFDGLKKISEEWYKLSQNYNKLTDEQKKKVEEYSTVLSDRLGIAVEDIDGVTGAYIGTKESLDKLIESTESYYMILGAQDIMAKLYEDKSNAMINYNKATSDFRESLEALNHSQLDGYYLNLDWSKSTEELAQDLIDLYYAELAMAMGRGSMTGAQQEAIEASRGYAEAIFEQKEAISRCDEEIAIARGVIDTYSNNVVVAGGTMSNSWATGTTALRRHTEEVQNSMSTMSNSWASGSAVAKRMAEDNQIAIDDLVTAWQNGETDVCIAVDALTGSIKGSFDNAYGDIKSKAREMLDDLKKMFEEYSPGISGVAIGGAAFVGQVPHLATGGVATSSVLANIGEAGREVVLPLENNTEWMDMLADRIGADRSISITFEGDLAQLGRVLKPVLDKENRRIGRSFLIN